MKIINAKVEELVQKPGYEGMLEQIERGGRVCYKSEDKITPGSAEKFVNTLINRKHFAPLEHGTVYLVIPGYNDSFTRKITRFFLDNKYSHCEVVWENDLISTMYVTTNYRVIVEHNLQEKIQKYIVDSPKARHRIRRSFMITCDRGISHELVRHRVMSFNQESTRYVNYSQDKWGNEITVIKPCFWEESDPRFITWKNACLDAEENYMMLLREGATPQEARAVLPNSTKTELLMTGFVDGNDGWEHFLNLRCDKAAHPQAREVANMIKDLLNPIQAEAEIIK